MCNGPREDKKRHWTSAAQGCGTCGFSGLIWSSSPCSASDAGQRRPSYSAFHVYPLLLSRERQGLWEVESAVLRSSFEENSANRGIEERVDDEVGPVRPNRGRSTPKRGQRGHDGVMVRPGEHGGLNFLGPPGGRAWFAKAAVLMNRVKA